ncbi:MAG: hypothetical protein HY979_00200 [Candidatus Magasanikbacteria bacterium]|nr:hypothetical protein [Candidatus Magasanikbacteria bacterium]
MQYVFILGHNPKLSVAEIKAVLPKAKEVIEAGSFLILSFDAAQDGNKSCQALLNRLGGTIKIGEIISEQIKLEVIVERLKKMTSNKINFGISCYGCKNDNLGMAVKKELRRQGINSRLVTSKEKVLSSVVITKNQCQEFLILNNQWLAMTGAVQEFEEYSQRDYGRPVRDMLSGTMPPKLAKIMINLAQAPAGAVILDPFCGSGTILQEAVLFGYQVIGSDVSDKAVKDTKKNLEWLGRHAEFISASQEIPKQVRDDKIRTFQCDVKQLSKKIDQVDVVVTEPYLGPALKGNETKGEIERIINELSKLYLKAFGEFRKILTSGGKIVIVFPAFRVGKEILELPILASIKKLGFSQLNKDQLIYSRPEQKVWRQIYVFS